MTLVFILQFNYYLDKYFLIKFKSECMKKFLGIFLISTLLFGCTAQQIQETVGAVLGTTYGDPTEQEAGQGDIRGREGDAIDLRQSHGRIVGQRARRQRQQGEEPDQPQHGGGQRLRGAARRLTARGLRLPARSHRGAPAVGLRALGQRAAASTVPLHARVRGGREPAGPTGR